jgi:hypothetical protein
MIGRRVAIVDDKAAAVRSQAIFGRFMDPTDAHYPSVIASNNDTFISTIEKTLEELYVTFLDKFCKYFDVNR